MRLDQDPKVVSNDRAPRIRAVVVALESGDEALVGEAEFGPVALLGNVEDDAGALPLVLGRDEGGAALDNKPHDPFAGHELGYLLLGDVQVLVAVGKDTTHLVRRTFELPRPPSARVGDRVEHSRRQARALRGVRTHRDLGRGGWTRDLPPDEEGTRLRAGDHRPYEVG